MKPRHKSTLLYNWWVMRLRNGEHWNVNRAKQSLRESKQSDPELCSVYGKLLAEVYFQNIRARLTEPLPAHFHEVAVSRDAQGNYFCSFVYDAAAQHEDETHKTPKKRKKRKQRPFRDDGIVAFDLGIKTLATGYTDQGRFYHIGGFKGYRWYNKQLDKIRSKRDRCQKKSRRYIHLSQVYKRVAEQKRRKQQDCLHKASHLIAHRLAERAVVIGDLSQRQMVIKKQEEETPKERNKRHIRNRMVYNDWGLYAFMQMLVYKCLRFGKDLHSTSVNAIRPRCVAFVKRSKRCHYGNGCIAVRTAAW